MGTVGAVAKPVSGVLDLASGITAAIRLVVVHHDSGRLFIASVIPYMSPQFWIGRSRGAGVGSHAAAANLPARRLPHPVQCRHG